MRIKRAGWFSIALAGGAVFWLAVGTGLLARGGVIHHGCHNRNGYRYLGLVRAIRASLGLDLSSPVDGVCAIEARMHPPIVPRAYVDGRTHCGIGHRYDRAVLAWQEQVRRSIEEGDRLDREASSIEDQLGAAALVPHGDALMLVLAARLRLVKVQRTINRCRTKSLQEAGAVKPPARPHVDCSNSTDPLCGL